MQSPNTQPDLQGLIRIIGPHLKDLIREKKLTISKAVDAPFQSVQCLADFNDAPWPGEWDNKHNY